MTVAAIFVITLLLRLNLQLEKADIRSLVNKLAWNRSLLIKFRHEDNPFLFCWLAFRIFRTLKYFYAIDFVCCFLKVKIRVNDIKFFIFEYSDVLVTFLKKWIYLHNNPSNFLVLHGNFCYARFIYCTKIFSHCRWTLIMETFDIYDSQ